jgi:hypothetical protein
MDVDFVGMGMELVDGALAVGQNLALGGDFVTLGIAAVAIVLMALFMSSLESIISTTMVSLFVFVVLKIVYGASQSEWDFAGPVNETWAAFAGDGGLTFFTFFSYFLVFAVAIAIVNVIRNVVAG